MISHSTIIKFVLFGFVLFGFGVVVLNVISYSRRPDEFDLNEQDDELTASFPIPDTSIKTKTDFTSDIRPSKLTLNNSKKGISKIPVRTYNISINNDENKNILVREAGEGNYHVLLLHGEKYSSKTWQRIGTLQYLSKWGYRAFAIDIPSNGTKALPVTGDKEAVQWLTKLIRTLSLSNLVIISPSLSGQITLPYIFQLKQQQQLIRGFVAIAPIGTDRFANDYYRQVNIPTLVVHSEKDSKFQPAYELLIQIPDSKVLFMIDAGHASYVEKPLDFHNGLRQFLYDVYWPLYSKSVVPKKTKYKPKRRQQQQQ